MCPFHLGMYIDYVHTCISTLPWYVLTYISRIEIPLELFIPIMFLHLHIHTCITELYINHPTDREDSICYTGTSTCCSQQLQYNLSRMARKEFLKSFSYLVLLGTPQCSSLRAANQLLKSQSMVVLCSFVVKYLCCV